MQLVLYKIEREARLGALLDNWVLDIRGAFRALKLGGHVDRGEHETTDPMIRFLTGGSAALQGAQNALNLVCDASAAKSAWQDFLIPQDRLTLLPPLVRPGKIICVGLNYPAPGARHANSVPDYPVLFLKVSSSLTGHLHPILIPSISKEVLYEGELAVVIGRRGKYIPREDALDHIAGYTIANDVGARDLERRTSQWTSGKILDTFCPLGPTLVTRDEISNPNDISIKTTLNQRTVQDGSTSEMIFDIAYLVSYISNLTTLEIGDLILTGSPKRNGGTPDPRLPMHPGDVVSVEIEKLGILTNPIKAEEA